MVSAGSSSRGASPSASLVTGSYSGGAAAAEQRTLSDSVPPAPIDTVSKGTTDQPDPLSPVTRLVRRSRTLNMPTVALVHQVSLNNLQPPVRSQSLGERTCNQTSEAGAAAASSSHPGVQPDVQRRFSTGGFLSAGIGDVPDTLSKPVLKHPLARRNTVDGSDVAAASLARASAESESPNRRPSSATRLRPAHRIPSRCRALSQQEVDRNEQEATEWFRAARRSNRSYRSVEEVEGILAEARSRKKENAAKALGWRPPRPSHSDSLVARAEVEQEDDSNAKLEDVEGAVQSASSWRSGRSGGRCVDPLALWGAKPLPKKEAEPAPKKKDIFNAKVGALQEGVRAGHTDLLQRLARRRSLSPATRAP